MSGDDSDQRCPSCGGNDVRCYDDGRKDCLSCTWEYRPSKSSTQQGLSEFNQ